jgi:hypothetical protein
MNRNCPNCGAPYDINADTCPYCKTSYFDLTAIDIGCDEPFFLKLKFNGAVFTSKVVVGGETSIELHEDEVCAFDAHENKLARIVISRGCDVSITFKSVADNGVLFRIDEYKE